LSAGIARPILRATPRVTLNRGAGTVLRLVLVCSIALAACGTREPDPAVQQTRTLPAVIEVEEPDHSEFEALARAATNRLQLQLKQELEEAVVGDGPAAAVEICSRRAAEVTRDVSERTGLEVRRVSLQNRNPQNQATAGEASVLALMAARADLADTMIVRDGRPLYVRAIRIGTPVCLQCHGQRSELGEGVAETLDALYVDDRATGFREGDLRGAFVVRPLD
jgi:hypothetical protein